MTLDIRSGVPFSTLTSLELGGPAKYLVEAANVETLASALEWAAGRDLGTFILGAGSNVVASDEGHPGLVVRMVGRGLAFESGGHVTAQAGESWDGLVSECVDRGLAGLECLSGIPGTVGAAPVQNVGAYGQQIADVFASARVIDRETAAVVELGHNQCAFGYRDSVFKREPDRYVVTSVTLRLTPGGVPSVVYDTLAAALAGKEAPTLSDVRRAVLGLRGERGMLLGDGIHSAGSFFLNPVLPHEEARRVVDLCVEQGLASTTDEVPTYAAADGRTKLAAGWLIEKAGVPRGHRMGNVALSEQHALCLVNLGEASTSELLALARHVRDAVSERFDVTLEPEPVHLGVSL